MKIIIIINNNKNRLDHYMDAYHSRTPSHDRHRLVNSPLHNGASSTLRHHVFIRFIHPNKVQVGVLCFCNFSIFPAYLPASPRCTSLGQAVRNFKILFPSDSVHPILLVCISTPSPSSLLSLLHTL